MKIQKETLKEQLRRLGYTLLLWKQDSRGKLHRYRTSPLNGAGPTNYFDDAKAVEKYIRQVTEVRIWQKAQ